MSENDILTQREKSTTTPMVHFGKKHSICSVCLVNLKSALSESIFVIESRWRCDASGRFPLRELNLWPWCYSTGPAHSVLCRRPAGQMVSAGGRASQPVKSCMMITDDEFGSVQEHEYRSPPHPSPITLQPHTDTRGALKCSAQLHRSAPA